MKEIEQAVKYLKSVSLKEPIEIRVEEVEFNRIVLSFKEKNEYLWLLDRQMKEFIFENGEVVKMKSFN